MTYLDYQATTPLAPEAFAAMVPWLRDQHANPHSAHRPGRAAKAAVEVARAQVEALFARTGGQLAFTSGATEALNWAIKGTSGPIVTIATEHAAVLDTVAAEARRGREVTVLPVDGDGLLDLDAAQRAIRPGQGGLVAAMLVNNEIGVIQPVDALAALAANADATLLCDAVQGFGRVSLPAATDNSLIAISAHKVHGPKGVGALWIGAGAAGLAPLLHGGGQEAGGRSGTLSPALCAGFGTAAALLAAQATSDADHVARLWDVATGALGDGWIVNGSVDRRYRGNLNVRFPGLDVARLMSDLPDIAISAGSACASGSGRPSHVLRALGLGDAEARCSIRLGFGRYTTADQLAEAVGRIDAAARAADRGVTLVRFIGADGAVSERVGRAGERLLDVAQADDQPLEGTCGGDLACATCHVIVSAADFARLPPASEDEEDMLDLVAQAGPTSRLACQVRIDPRWDRLEVRIPRLTVTATERLCRLHINRTVRT